MRLTRDGRIRAIAAAVVVVAAAVFTRDPIPQDQGYHRFADRRSLAGIPNAGDVLSNLPFLAVGLAGAASCGRALGRDTPAFASRAEALPWMVFFTAVALTGLGSAFYHWSPADAALLWDRLPLSLTCAAFLGAALTERVGARQGLLTLPVLLAYGPLSVVHWYRADDLRYYVALQLAAFVVVPLLVALLPSSHSHGRGWLAAVGLYGLAKLSEWGDAAVFGLGQVVSGHTLKHLLAALAAAALLLMLRRRRVGSTA